jgi:tetratricopeptide (TPR) repeat protein
VNQFKGVLEKQAAPYTQAAKSLFSQCLQNGEKFEVFSAFVKGCQSQGQAPVNEAEETRVVVKASNQAPRGADQIRQKLYDSPRDVDLLKSLARSYTEGKDYAMSLLILNRVIEISPRSVEAISMQGMNYLFMNDLENARLSFQSALKKSPKDATALWGMAALYNEFKYAKRAREFLGRAKAAGKPETPVFDWVLALL